MMPMLKRGSSMYVTLLLGLLALFWLFPIYIVVVNAFKPAGAMYNSILALPGSFYLDNFAAAFDKLRFGTTFVNTLILTAGGVISINLVGSAAGYKLARTRTRLSSFILYMFVASMMVPIYAIMIPIFVIARDLQLQGTLYGMIALYVGLGVAMAVFLYHGFVKSLSKDLDESAMMDGCGPWKTFMRIIFPLLTPITVTISIMNMLWIWNDFLMPLIMLPDPKHHTLMLATNAFFGEWYVEWPPLLASLVVTSLPVLLFFVVFQKYVIAGITEGAVKG